MLRCLFGIKMGFCLDKKFAYVLCYFTRWVTQRFRCLQHVFSPFISAISISQHFLQVSRAINVQRRQSIFFARCVFFRRLIKILQIYQLFNYSLDLILSARTQLGLYSVCVSVYSFGASLREICVFFFKKKNILVDLPRVLSPSANKQKSVITSRFIER